MKGVAPAIVPFSWIDVAGEDEMGGRGTRGGSSSDECGGGGGGGECGEGGDSPLARVESLGMGLSSVLMEREVEREVEREYRARVAAAPCMQLE